MGYTLGWRVVRVFCWIFTALGILMGALLLMGIFVFPWSTRDDFLTTFNDIWLVFLCLFIGIGGNLAIPTYERRVKLFIAAREGQFDVVPQAIPQPAPDSTLLSIPTTIELISRRRVILGWVIAIYATIAIILAPVLIVVSKIAPDESYVTIFCISGTFFYVLVASMLIALAPHQTIRVTEAGLTLRSNDSHTIAWDDARIFALVSGRQQTHSTRIYAISSGRSTVRWTHRSRAHWYSVTVPITSDEEYQRQMEALLSYAAARTGLPLLDLR
jgi:hypothetical protein